MYRIASFGRAYNNFARFGSTSKLAVTHQNSAFNALARDFHTPRSKFSGQAFGGKRLFCNERWPGKLLIKPFLFTAFVGCTSFTVSSLWQCKKKDKMTENNTTVTSHSSDRRIIIPMITGVKAAIYLLWQVRRPPFPFLMEKYFQSGPFKAVSCRPMISAPFSHNKLNHLLANMFFIWMFGYPVAEMLEPEQFLASYVTAAVVSGFGGYVYKIIINTRLSSLGASGVMFFLFGVWLIGGKEFQIDSFLDLFFQTAYLCSSGFLILVLFGDIYGLFDMSSRVGHASHLTGFLFGVWYAFYGRELYQKLRVSVCEKLKEIRSRESGNRED